MLGLGLAGVAGQPALLTQGREVGGAPGQDLVDVGLVAGVEDDPVRRRVEDAVDGEGQLDDAEVGSEVAAGLGHLGDEEGADLLGELTQLRVIEVAQVAAVRRCPRAGSWIPFRRTSAGRRPRPTEESL